MLPPGDYSGHLRGNLATLIRNLKADATVSPGGGESEGRETPPTAASRHRPCPLSPTGCHGQGSFRVSASPWLAAEAAWVGAFAQTAVWLPVPARLGGREEEAECAGGRGRVSKGIRGHFHSPGTHAAGAGARLGGRLAEPLGSQTFASFPRIHHTSLFRVFVDKRDACPSEGIRALWLDRVSSSPGFSAADHQEEPSKGRCPRGPGEIRVAGEGAWEKEAKVSRLMEGDGPHLDGGRGKSGRCGPFRFSIS